MNFFLVSLSPGFAIWSVGVLLSVMVFIYEKESGPGKPKISRPKTKPKKKVEFALGFTKKKPIGLGLSLTTVDD